MNVGKITVRAFKSLEDVSVDLGLVNVFIGANGSGKSNFLEAIGVLSAAASGRVDAEALLRRGVRPGAPALYRCALPDSKAKDITFEAYSSQDAPSEKAFYRVSLFNPLNSPEESWRFHTENWQDSYGNKIVGRSHHSKNKTDLAVGLAALKAAEIPVHDQDATFLRTLQNYALYSPNTPMLRGIIPDFQQRSPLGLSGGRLSEAVGEILKGRWKFTGDTAKEKEYHAFAQRVCREARGLIDWIKSYGAGDAEQVPSSSSVPTSKRVVYFEDRYMRGGRNVLSGYDASEGALYVLFHAVLAAHPGAPLFYAVDNADHSLNPRLSRALFRSLCEWHLDAPVPRQVLLTTHNPLALDGLRLDDDRVRLFIVSKTHKGKTTVERLTFDAQLRALSEKGWTLSRLWVSGKIGGVPDVF